MTSAWTLHLYARLNDTLTITISLALFFSSPFRFSGDPLPGDREKHTSADEDQSKRTLGHSGGTAEFLNYIPSINPYSHPAPTTFVQLHQSSRRHTTYNDLALNISTHEGQSKRSLGRRWDTAKFLNYIPSINPYSNLALTTFVQLHPSTRRYTTYNDLALTTSAFEGKSKRNLGRRWCTVEFLRSASAILKEAYHL